MRLAVLSGALVADAAFLAGQATPFYETPPFRATDGHPEYSQQNWSPPGASPVNMVPRTPTGLPGVNVTQSPAAYRNQTQPPGWALPNQYSTPNRQQTEWFVENNSAFRNLDAVAKTNLINGVAPSFLAGPYLPNGSSNPIYQNGQILPNWYLPSTWPSPSMSWQNVGPSGFLPSPSPGAYSLPSTTSAYNSSSNYRTNFNPPPAFNATGQSPTRLSVTSSNLNSETQPNRFAAVTLDRGLPEKTNLSVLFKVAHERSSALALHESADDKVTQAIDHSQLASLFLALDNPEQALAQVEFAEPTAAASSDRDLELTLMRVKAAAQISSGAFEQAVATYRELMRFLRLRNDEPSQAATSISLAWAFQALGKVNDAMVSYADAQHLFHQLNDSNGETNALIGMGSLYVSMGDFEKARQKYVSALKIANDDQSARIFVSYAEMLQSRGLHQLALNAYDKAFALMGKDDRVLAGTVEAGMGRSDVALGFYAAARNRLDSAAALMKDAGDRRGEAGIEASIAQLNFVTSFTSGRKDDLIEARNGYAHALALMREISDRAGEIGVLAGIGQVFEAEGKRGEAIDSFREALAKLEDLRSSARLEEFRIDEANQSENLYSHVVELETSTHNMEEAFNLSERARARNFLDLLGNTRSSTQRGFPAAVVQREDELRKQNILLERQLGQEFAKPIPEVDAQRMRSLQTRLSNLRQQYQQSLDELKAANPVYASFLSVAPLNLREVQQQLDPDVTSLSYITLPDATLAFVVTRDSFHAFRLPITESSLALATSALLDFAGDSETSEVTKQLYKSLIAPLRSQLKTHTLLISPYGVLHSLPFAALSPDGKQYLGDLYAISILPSISAWPYLHAKRRNDAESALVMASDDVEGLPQLSGGHSEAEFIASLFGSKPLFGKAADVATLRERGGDYSILHLMAHLNHDDENPRSSRIVLAQDLDIDEVLNLDLRKTSLVVLSGCQSGKGERTRGDDIVALSRAFMYAGAPTVIASLWSVDDEATRQLMVSFYAHLHSGLSKADALQAAQKDVRHTHPNPYYWASFELIGDPGASQTSRIAIAANAYP